MSTHILDEYKYTHITLTYSQHRGHCTLVLCEFLNSKWKFNSSHDSQVVHYNVLPYTLLFTVSGHIHHVNSHGLWPLTCQQVSEK